MAKKRSMEEQIIRILKEIESGKAVAEVARQYGVSEPTLFRRSSTQFCIYSCIYFQAQFCIYCFTHFHTFI